MKFIYLLFVFLFTTSNGAGILESSKIEKKEITAGLNCTQYDAYGIQRCIAGINSNVLDIAAYDIQYANQWCWAASIETVLNYYGYNISQYDIVYQTWGKIVNMPGSSEQILSALNRNYIDRNGNHFRVEATAINVTPARASQDLANDNPLIIGTMGHAMVLTALEYDKDRFGNGNVINATVRDPWPKNHGRRVLSAQEWYSTDLLVRIRVY